MKQNMQNQTISALYTDDKKWEYSSNLNGILQSAKKFYEKLYTKETTLRTPTAEFSNKISDRNNISNKQFYHYEAHIF